MCRASANNHVPFMWAEVANVLKPLTLLAYLTHTSTYRIAGTSNHFQALIPPILTVLSLTAVGLFAIVCIVVGALFRRQQKKYVPPQRTKIIRSMPNIPTRYQFSFRLRLEAETTRRISKTANCTHKFPYCRQTVN